MLKVEWVALEGTVERLVIDHRDNDPARYLTREEPFVYVILHACSYAVTFTYDASNWILGVPDFECFSLRDKHARRNVHFTNQQFTFVYLDAKRGVLRVRHQAECVLRTYETKLRADVRW